MIARLLVLALIAPLCACAGVGEGDANYDALKAATEQCSAQGGVLQPKSGYDGRDLSGYTCQKGSAK